MSFYLIEDVTHSDGYEYRHSFILNAEDTPLPSDIEQLLTAFQYSLSLDDVQGDEVWSDCRIVSCHVKSEVPERDVEVLRRYMPVISLSTVIYNLMELG